MFAVWIAIILLTSPDDPKPGAAVEPNRGNVVFFDLQKDRPDAASGEMAEVSSKQVARQAVAAPRRIDRNGKYLGLVGGDPRNDESDDIAPDTEPVRQRVALLQQL